MIWVIIAIIVTLYGFYIFSDDIIPMLIIGSSLGCFFITIGFASSTVLGGANREYVLDSPYNVDIYSLSQHTSVEGSFVLGSGSINSSNYYYYYVKEPQGYKLYKADADNTYIKMDEEVTPHITVTTESVKNVGWTLWWYVAENTRVHNVVLHVPKNTIQEKYSVN